MFLLQEERWGGKKVRYIVIGVVSLITAIIQANFAGYIEVFGVKPNLFIILITSLALLGGAFHGAVAGLIAGFAQDVVIGTSIGGYTLLGMYLGLIVGLVNKRFVRDSILVAIPFVLLTSVVYESVIYFFSFFLYKDTNILYAYSNIIIPESIYNTLAAIIIFPALYKLNNWIEERTKTARSY